MKWLCRVQLTKFTAKLGRSSCAEEAHDRNLDVTTRNFHRTGRELLGTAKKLVARDGSIHGMKRVATTRSFHLTGVARDDQEICCSVRELSRQETYYHNKKLSRDGTGRELLGTGKKIVVRDRSFHGNKLVVGVASVVVVGVAVDAVGVVVGVAVVGVGVSKLGEFQRVYVGVARYGGSYVSNYNSLKSW